MYDKDNNNDIWKRDSFDISYSQNEIPRKFSTPENPSFYYTLSFTYTFKYKNDKVYFCHSFPYTYSDLMTYLQALVENPLYTYYLKIDSLCNTLAGNMCPILTITDDINSYKEYITGKFNKNKYKKAIILTARVHPGETNSSYIIKGIIDYLVSCSHHGKSLRKKFVFKIVPMLNPDGVIYGNYRCSLLGVDLNRR